MIFTNFADKNRHIYFFNRCFWSNSHIHFRLFLWIYLYQIIFHELLFSLLFVSQVCSRFTIVLLFKPYFKLVSTMAEISNSKQKLHNFIIEVFLSATS